MSHHNEDYNGELDLNTDIEIYITTDKIGRYRQGEVHVVKDSLFLRALLDTGRAVVVNPPDWEPRKLEDLPTFLTAKPKPVVEEPKVEEPKAVEPVAEEPVAEEAVAEEPVVEAPKAEEPVKRSYNRNLSTKSEDN